MKTKKTTTDDPMSANQLPSLPSAAPTPAIPIVGIGASAGGLAAFEAFFRHVPEDCGMAFVLIMHLDPNHPCLLAEILQRVTAMPVVEALDQMVVAINHVYIIPPNCDMEISHGKLQIQVPIQQRGHRMPIDLFLCALAKAQQERAMGIILSGSGSDGTLGLRAIFGVGGLTLVQETATAQYTGMLVSAINAGYATHILAVEKMPAVLLASLQQLKQTITPTLVPIEVSGLNRILMQLKTLTGHDFSLYKKSTINRRIERRMALHNLDNAEAYARYLKENPTEGLLLFKELLINVTSFFRDKEAFSFLQQQILPQLFQDKPEGYVFRVWIAGCATGEEAYTIAILLREWLLDSPIAYTVQIYSTDLDDDAITFARAGIYPSNIVKEVSPERLQRFFVKEAAGYRVCKEIREMVVFAVQNVVKDPPFTKLDLLSCRNLMIYFEAELQNRLMPTFHFALKPGGLLLLSPSEGVGNHLDLFRLLNRKWKFYSAVHAPSATRTTGLQDLTWVAKSSNPPPEYPVTKPVETNFAELTRSALIQFFAPAAVVTDCNGDIFYVHGDTGKYLRPAPGHASLNVMEMAREGLEGLLRTAICNAVNEKMPILNQAVSIKTDGEFAAVSLSVRPLYGEAGNPTQLLISFQDIAQADPKPPRKRAVKPAELSRIEALERELTYQKENQQVMIEEQQASNEELKSTNEELQSSNEELQSANEELNTSKEELQSINEELITVNAELQSKIEQLACMQNDVKNLLDNTNIGIIFLDRRLRIRSFTRPALNVYRLVATDVGRPLIDIKTMAGQDDGLISAAQEVLNTLIPYERKLCIIEGNWILVRIQPYRTLDDMIDGVVMAFTDISLNIKAIAAETAEQLTQDIFDTLHDPLMVVDDAFKVVSASRAFYQIFHTTPEETLGYALKMLNNGQWDIPRLHELLETNLSREGYFEKFAMVVALPEGGAINLLLSARRMRMRFGAQKKFLLSMEISA